MKDYLKLEVDISDRNLVSVIDELPLWSAPFGLKLLETIKLRKNLKALDIGCGLGFPLIELSQRLGKTSQVYGIDPWQEALDRVRFKLTVYNIKNVKLFNIHAEEMLFEDESIDLIVSNNGLNNVENLTQTMRECFRICKPGSQMVFTLNTEDSMIEFYKVFENVLIEYNLVEEVEKMKQQIYSKRKPRDEIEAITKNAGFTITRVIQDSFKMSFIDGTSMLNHNLIKYWFMDGWKKIVQSQDLERVFEKVELKLNEQSKINGKMILTVPYLTFDCHKN